MSRILMPPPFITVDLLSEGKLASPAALAGEDEGEGTFLTEWGANHGRDASFQCAALTLTLSHAGSGMGEGNAFSI